MAANWRFCVIALLTIPLWGPNHALGQEGDSSGTDSRHDRVRQLLEATSTGKNPGRDAIELIPELIEIAEASSSPRGDLAIRALGQLKSAASPAIPVLCRRLDDSNHGTRSLAADALVAIGGSSTEPLRELIKAPSGRVRAAALAALSRFGAVEPDLLDAAVHDPDPRVRVAALRGSNRAEPAADSRLLAGLLDKDSAVFTEAANGLKLTRGHPEMAIPRLVSALSDEGSRWAAGTALAAYGVEANSSIPMLLRAYPLGSTSRFVDTEDVVEYALKHIGPPRPEDLMELTPFLAHQDPEVQILAATTLSMAGTAAKAMAPAIERALELSFERFNNSSETSGRDLVAMEYLVAADWQVARSPEQFLKQFEKLVNLAEGLIQFSWPTPWQGFSEKDFCAIEPILRTADRHLRIAILEGLLDVDEKPVCLKRVLLDLVKAEDTETSSKAMMALVSLGPRVADDVGPILLARYRNDQMPLRDFVVATGHLKIQSADFQDILERGANDVDRRTATMSAEILCQLSLNHRQTAALILEGAGSPQRTHRDAIQALSSLTPPETSVLPYLVEQLSSDDLWTRHDSVRAIGQFGPAASHVLEKVVVCLQDKSDEIRLQAAKTIFQISGDDSHWRAAFEVAVEGDNVRLQYVVIRAVSELGKAGDPFVKPIAGLIKNPDLATSIVNALKQIGSPVAVAELKRIAKSTDWELRSTAILALDELRTSEKKGD